MAGFGFVLVVVGLGLMGLMLAALISLATATDQQMAKSGFNRYVWLAIVVVLPVLGSIAYFAVAYPKIRQSSAAERRLPASDAQ